MDLSRINANLLVALDLLLAEESVARAADRHGVTPSAMSHSLRALREIFSDPLLTKTRNGMRPTPYAATLKSPLRRALRDLERAVSGGLEFDPRTAERAFVVAAPDFLSTLLLPRLAQVVAEQAPRVDVEVRPIRRGGSSLLFRDLAALADGDIDVVLGAVVDPHPELRRAALYEERFACIVRQGHPLVGAALDLATYAAIPQVVTTITDERTPTWIDEELARHDLRRRVALRTRYFMSVPLVVARTDLLATVPFQVARYFADDAGLRVLAPPLPLPTYEEHVAWHIRYDGDPAVLWLRDLLREVARDAVHAAPRGDAPRGGQL